MCAPLRTAGLAAGKTLRWSEQSALSMAARGALPDDILQGFLPQACLRNSCLFLLNSLAAWGLTLCDLLSDISLARARAFWDYDARLARRHFDGRHTLAHAEAVLGFYVFGLACSHYLVRIYACDTLLVQTEIDLVHGVMALECAKPHELPKYRACLLSVLPGNEMWKGGGGVKLKALKALHQKKTGCETLPQNV